MPWRSRLVGEYRIDLVVERCLILECKTADSLSNNYHTQIRNYLRISGLSLGMILLFGSKHAFQRVVFETARMPSKKKF